MLHWRRISWSTSLFGKSRLWEEPGPSPSDTVPGPEFNLQKSLLLAETSFSLHLFPSSPPALPVPFSGPRLTGTRISRLILCINLLLAIASLSALAWQSQGPHAINILQTDSADTLLSRVLLFEPSKTQDIRKHRYRIASSKCYSKLLRGVEWSILWAVGGGAWKRGIRKSQPVRF